MGARVHVVQLTGHYLFHAHEVVRKCLQSEFARFGLGGCRVQRIGRMRQDAIDSVFLAHLMKGGKIFLVEVLRLPAAGVAREELERVRADRCGIARRRR